MGREVLFFDLGMAVTSRRHNVTGNSVWIIAIQNVVFSK
jgi:hypothetical protein